jgi:hypothetical protein
MFREGNRLDHIPGARSSIIIMIMKVVIVLNNRDGFISNRL